MRPDRGVIAATRQLGREGDAEGLNALAQAHPRMGYARLVRAWREGLQENPEYRSPVLEALLAATNAGTPES